MMLKMFFLFFFITFNTHAFTLNNNVAASFKMEKIPVDVNEVGCPNAGLSADYLMELISEAISDYWNKVPTSSLHLVKGSIKNVSGDFYTEELCTPGTSCTPNPQLIVPQNILISCNENTTTFNFLGILGVTLPNNVEGRDIKGALLLINDRNNSPFSHKARDEQVAIIAHEIGHAIGLGHSSEKDSLMYYESVPTRRSLGADDIDGATYLYPKKQAFDINCGAVFPINSDGGRNGKNIFLSFLFLLILAISVLKFQRPLSQNK